MANMLKCPNCGATLRLENGKIKCSHCGMELQLQEDHTLELARIDSETTIRLENIRQRHKSKEPLDDNRTFLYVMGGFFGIPAAIGLIV